MSGLHVSISGPETGPVALLVHGLFADHSNWWQLAPILAGRGYRVIAPDLAGHGLSKRRSRYSIASWAGDLVEEFSGIAIDLAIGHSLGGAALLLARPHLTPHRTVYLDPTWMMTAVQHERFGAIWRDQLDWMPERWGAAYPRWGSGDIESRVASLRLMDPHAIEGLAPGGGHDFRPTTVTGETLLIAADPSDFHSRDEQKRLTALGVDVRQLPGVGHAAFREDFDGFLRVLDSPTV